MRANPLIASQMVSEFPDQVLLFWIQFMSGTIGHDSLEGESAFVEALC